MLCSFLILLITSGSSFCNFPNQRTSSGSGFLKTFRNKEPLVLGFRNFQNQRGFWNFNYVLWRDLWYCECSVRPSKLNCKHSGVRKHNPWDKWDRCILGHKYLCLLLKNLCVVGLGDCWIYAIVGVMSVNANTFYFPWFFNERFQRDLIPPYPHHRI